MNLRRILQGFTLCLFLSLFSTDMNAQAQLAGVNSDGLIQLGANHPFVVDEYVIDIRPLGLLNVNAAVEAFSMYTETGAFSFNFDMNAQIATMTVETALIADTKIAVADMNAKLRSLHQLKS